MDILQSLYVAQHAADVNAEAAEKARRLKENAKTNMNDIHTQIAILLSNGESSATLQLDLEQAMKQVIQSIKHAYATRVASLDAILKVQELYSIHTNYQRKRIHPSFNLL